MQKFRKLKNFFFRVLGIYLIFFSNFQTLAAGVKADRVIGMSPSEAAVELLVTGYLEVKSRQIPVCGKNEIFGKVIKAIPNKEKPGDEITIVFKVGGAKIPDVRGLSLEEAQKRLKAAGFERIQGVNEKGTVIGVMGHRAGTCLARSTVLVVEIAKMEASYVPVNKCRALTKSTTVLRSDNDKYVIWGEGSVNEHQAYPPENFSLVATYDMETDRPFFISIFFDENSDTAEIRAVCKSTLSVMNKTRTRIDGLDRLRTFMKNEAVVLQTGKRELIVWEIERNNFRNFFTGGVIGDISVGVTENGIRVPILLRSGKVMIWDSGLGNLGKTLDKIAGNYTRGDRILNIDDKIYLIGASGWHSYDIRSSKWKQLSNGSGNVVAVKEFQNAENPDESGVFVISSQYSDGGPRYLASIIKLEPNGGKRLTSLAINLNAGLGNKRVEDIWLKGVETRTINDGVSILLAYSEASRKALTCIDIGGFYGGEKYAVAKWEDTFKGGVDPGQLRFLRDGNHEILAMTDASIDYNRKIGGEDEGCTR